MTIRQRVAAYLRTHHGATRRQVADALGLTYRQVASAADQTASVELVRNAERTRIEEALYDAIERDGPQTITSLGEMVTMFRKKAMGVALCRMADRGVLTRRQVASSRPSHPYVWEYAIAQRDTAAPDADVAADLPPWVHPIRAGRVALAPRVALPMDYADARWRDTVGSHRS